MADNALNQTCRQCKDNMIITHDNPLMTTGNALPARKRRRGTTDYCSSNKTRRNDSSNHLTRAEKEEEEEEEEEDEVVEVKKKMVALQRIVPGGEALGADKLFEETAGYILALQCQIKAMRVLTTLIEALDKHKSKLGG